MGFLHSLISSMGHYLYTYIKMEFFLQLQSHIWLFATHGPQNTRLPSPALSSGNCTNCCPMSRWCHPTNLSSVCPYPSACNLSQHQGLLQWLGSSHQVAKVLELQLQHQLFQWIFRVDFFRIDWFLLHQLSHLYMTTGKTIALTKWTLSSKWCLYFLVSYLLLS